MTTDDMPRAALRRCVANAQLAVEQIYEAYPDSEARERLVRLLTETAWTAHRAVCALSPENSLEDDSGGEWVFVPPLHMPADPGAADYPPPAEQ